MKSLITLFTMISMSYAEQCNTSNHLEIKDTKFEEKILEHDPRLCFNKEKLNGEPDLAYRERLKNTFAKLDKIYNDKTEVVSGKGSPLSAFKDLEPELGRVEILGLTRMDTQSDKAGGSNRSWDYYGLEGRGRRLRVLSPIHDFIGKSNHIDKDKLAEKVISDMDRYNQKHNCQYGTQIVNMTRVRRLSKEHLEGSEIKSKYANVKEFKEALKKNKNQLDEIFNKAYPKEEGISRNYNCSNKYDTKDNSVTHQAEDSCNIQVSHQFANNSSEISIESLQENAGYQEFLKCVKKKKLTQKLRDISIKSSSNSIRNTGKDYESYNWRQLSEDRAINTSKVLYKALYPNGNNQGFKNWKKQFLNLNTAGTNGDGTSGPCALEWKDGKIKYKEDFLSTKGKRSLDKFKSVFVSARFTQNVKTTKKKPTFFYQKRCNEINYKCREYTPNDKNLIKRRKSVRNQEVFKSPSQF